MDSFEYEHTVPALSSWVVLVNTVRLHGPRFDYSRTIALDG